MVEFADLHLHSTFSTLDGFSLPAQIVARAKELGRKHIALTDHGSISGFIQLEDEARKAGIHPVFGYEAYAVHDIGEMYAKKQRQKFHLTLLAKNLEGYRNILKLASLAYSDGFYYRPTIDEKMLFEHSDGLVVFSGCWSGMLQDRLKNSDVDGAIAIAEKYRSVFGDRYYLETQHFDLFRDTIQALFRVSDVTKIPVVATCDPHYLEPTQAEIQEILHAIRDGRKFDATKILYGAYQWGASDLLVALRALSRDAPWEEIMNRSVEIAQSMWADPLPKGGAPRYGVANAHELLIQKCREGMQQRGLNGREEYEKRLIYELDIVQRKDFSDYFLVTAENVNWAKQHNILVGPGRGSSAGSLICYLLRINEVDPIKHDLMFERFIDIDRIDYPDIDLDFEKERREEAKRFIEHRYGEANVTNIATFATFKGKNSLDEIGKVFSIPATDIKTIKKYLVERSDADMRNQMTIRDTFEMSEEAKEVGKKYPNVLKAEELEGQYRHVGRHAAGIVISNTPLNEVMAIYKASNDQGVASFDMGDLEKMGFLKFDILGLSELSVIRYAAELAGMPFEDIYKISIDDEDTLNAFRSLDIAGIFQYDGDSTKSILRQMPHIGFKELVDCIALSKPGPSHCLSGGTLVYDCDRQKVMTISNAVRGKIKRTLSLFPDGSIRAQNIKEWRENGEQSVFKIRFSNGRKIKATGEHWFLCDGMQWKRLKDLKVGDKVYSSNKQIWNQQTGQWDDNHVPWNRDKKWPQSSEKAKERWKAGVYQKETLARWSREHPDEVRARAKRASLIRSQNLAKMSQEEKRIELANFIASGTKNGYGRWGDASDGHRTESSFELQFERFLISHRIDHEPHPVLSNRRRADQKIKGFYIELDGMQRSQSYWDEKYANGEPYIVIGYGDSFSEKMAFVFESPENCNWESVELLEILSIHDAGKAKVYDLTMEEIPNYLANGIVVHNSGASTLYLEAMRKGSSSGFTWHPILKEITKDTYGQILYQEQLMHILRKVGSMSWEDTGKIRKVISKSKGEQAFEAYWPKFLKGAQSNGFSEQDATKLWDAMKVFGRYAFNKSHSAAYAMLGFWDMYMKVHYPAEYFTSKLIYEEDDEKRSRLIKEAIRKGIRVLPPKVGKSKAKWTVERGSIRAGFSEIKNIGKKTAILLEGIEAKTKEELAAMKIKGVTKRGIEALDLASAFNDDDDIDFFNVSFFDCLDAIAPGRTKNIDIDDGGNQRRIRIAGIFREMNYKDIHEERRSRGQELVKKDPHIAKYAMMMMEDDTDRVLVMIDRYAFARLGEQVWDAFNNKKFVVIDGLKVAKWRIVRVNNALFFSEEDANNMMLSGPRKDEEDADFDLGEELGIKGFGWANQLQPDPPTKKEIVVANFDDFAP